MAADNREFNHLWDLSREIANLRSVNMLLQWDQETHMPPNGAKARAGQLELIAQLIHQRRTGKDFEKALAAVIDLDTGKLRVEGCSAAQKAAVREWRRDFSLATQLPIDFVRRWSNLTSEAAEVWRNARERSSFLTFAPYLERIVALCQEKAELLGYKAHPYDPLVDEYEPDMTYAQLTKLFGDLRKPLVALRNKLLTRKQPDCSFLQQRYGSAKQMTFAKHLLGHVGWTQENGAVDLTTHPFCLSLHPTDGRVTTRVNERDPLENFLASLHEGGHYLYEVNLSEKTWGSPLSEPVSMAVHESQSRWWETIVGQSHPFWKHAFPELKALFPKQLEGVGLSRFVKAVNALRLTPIRIETDEVSYCLHVILRFEIESALVDGSLKVRDLPTVWNEKMKELLGIEPENDARGCLQDIHWAWGHVGYFPTYALGNLYAAQFFDTFAKAHPDWEERIGKGEFEFMRDWLQHNIHQHGRRYRPGELMQHVTGKQPSPDCYLKYLTLKYS
jgi:carboxypeptidase Taq